MYNIIDIKYLLVTSFRNVLDYDYDYDYYITISLSEPHPPFINFEIVGKETGKAGSPHPPRILYLRVPLFRPFLRPVYFFTRFVVIWLLRLLVLRLFPNNLERDIPNKLMPLIIHYNNIKIIIYYYRYSFAKYKII